jgi:hypothetical protein
MAAERPPRTKAGKRAKRLAASEAEAMPPPTPKRQFVDIDPWAVLLEGLLEMPAEDEPTTHERAKGK